MSGALTGLQATEKPIPPSGTSRCVRMDTGEIVNGGFLTGYAAESRSPLLRTLVCPTPGAVRLHVRTFMLFILSWVMADP